MSAVYEGSQESPTSGEVLADVEMNMSHPDGDQDSGHLLIVRDAPEIFDADLFKNGNSTDRSFIVIGGSN